MIYDMQFPEQIGFTNRPETQESTKQDFESGNDVKMTSC
jgi:hypothetical protein